MATQTQGQKQQEIAKSIKMIYDNLLPPVQYRSSIFPYNDEEQMQLDMINFHLSHFAIEEIQHQFTFDKTVEHEGNIWYIFRVEPKVPKSQVKEFQLLIQQQQQLGCKIGKIKASNTRVEVLFGFSTPQPITFKVFLGQLFGKFKVRYSNYVEITYQPPKQTEKKQ